MRQPDRRPIDRFLQSLDTERRYSPHTRAAYARDLDRLHAFCVQDGVAGWDALDPARLRAWVARLHRQGLSGASLARWLSAARAFYRYLRREGISPANPFAGVRAPRSGRRLPKTLSVDGTFRKFIAPLGDRGIQFTTLPQTLTPSAFVTGTLFSGTDVIGTPTFQALERQNLTKTLAEPTLTAISGETASFLSGGEFPFPSGLDDNGNPIFEFRNFGIGLNFTPTVLDESRISMQVSMEISAIDNTLALTISGATIPGLSVKRTETTIDLPSGGTLMISGLLRDNLSDSISGFPYLKDVPVLGALFRSTQFQRQETELVVIVTAYIAKPADTVTSAALPTDGFEPASDIDIYLLGRLHRHYAKGERPLWADPLRGPFGYIMK